MKPNGKGVRIAVSAAALALGAVATYLAAQAATPREKVIAISARRFDYTPGHLTLKRGVPVILELTTQDVLMGFNLPDLGARADIVPGKPARLRLVPGKTGTFVFVCDIFCGTGHERMQGTVTVIE